jgi:hypothetical protein
MSGEKMPPVRMTTDGVAIGVAIDMTITEEGMVGTETETGLGTEVQTEIVGYFCYISSLCKVHSTAR